MKEKKNPRVDELRGEISLLEANYQRDLRVIAGEMERASRNLVKATGEKIAAVGRTMTEAMNALREAKERTRKTVQRDYERDLRLAESRRDRGLHEMDKAFLRERDAVNDANSEAVKPLEDELVMEQRNLSMSLRERLEARKAQFQEEARPLVEELTALEQSVRPKTAADVVVSPAPAP